MMSRLDAFWRQAKELECPPEVQARSRVRLEVYMEEPVRNEADDCLQEQMGTTSSLWATAKSPLLSADRKDAIRARLEAYAQPAEPVFARWMMTWKRATASLAAALSLGSMSLCYAAEYTVPGDTLYPVKTTINEPVMGSFSLLSPEARAAWKVRVTERRLWEQQLLLARGADPATIAALQEAIDALLQEAQAALQQWAAENPEKAQQLQMRIETILLRRESIRSGMELENSPLLTPLLERVRERRELRLRDR
jgi:hypothetical protein